MKDGKNKKRLFHQEYEEYKQEKFDNKFSKKMKKDMRRDKTIRHTQGLWDDKYK